MLLFQQLFTFLKCAFSIKFTVLSIIMLNLTNKYTMLSIIILSVVMLNVIMLNVVAPQTVPALAQF